MRIDGQPTAVELDFDPTNDELIDESGQEHRDQAGQEPEPVTPTLPDVEAQIGMTALYPHSPGDLVTRAKLYRLEFDSGQVVHLEAGGDLASLVHVVVGDVPDDPPSGAPGPAPAAFGATQPNFGLHTVRGCSAALKMAEREV